MRPCSLWLLLARPPRLHQLNALGRLQKLAVQLKATLEGLTDLKPIGDNFNWLFKVRCSGCREEHPNWMGIDATETRDISGSRGEANLVWRCQLCKKESNVSFDDSFKRSSASYTAEDSEEQRFATLAVLECRGCELTEFDPKGVWSAKGAESGTAGAGVSIMEVETRISRA
ncbi:hypothetical protein NBRC10513_000747 [Rhodotorula toruloides]